MPSVTNASTDDLTFIAGGEQFVVPAKGTVDVTDEQADELEGHPWLQPPFGHEPEPEPVVPAADPEGV